MSVVSADLVQYASANMPNDDSSTCGGAIDTLRRCDFTQLGANDTIQAVSSSAGDTTQTITVTGRDAQGRVVSQTITLTGVTPVNLSSLGTVERIIKAELSATCAGIVTVRRTTGPTTVRAIPVGERGFMAMFRQLASDPSVQKTYYTKTFWKNTNGSLAALSASVVQNADPSGDTTFALDASADASTSTANRVTSPGFTFNTTTKNVPGTDLASGSAIGVWFLLTLGAGAAALRTTYTSEIDFQSV